jgi:hypothetical protein
MKLSDIHKKMEGVFRDLSAVTGHADIDPAQEQRCRRVIPAPKNKAANELVLVCWSAVSGGPSDAVTDDDFDAGVLLSGQGEPEVTGALILGMCDRLLRMGVEAGAFHDITVPLELLARGYMPDDDDDGCGHA